MKLRDLIYETSANKEFLDFALHTIFIYRDSLRPLICDLSRRCPDDRKSIGITSLLSSLQLRRSVFCSHKYLPLVVESRCTRACVRDYYSLVTTKCTNMRGTWSRTYLKTFEVGERASGDSNNLSPYMRAVLSANLIPIDY